MTGRLFHDILLEQYRYPPGPGVTLPRHAHDEYHLCLNVGTPGQYHYRGAWHLVPPGSLTVIMPDEVHQARDPADRENESTYAVLYASSARMRQVAAELGGPRAGLPYFGDPVIADDDLAVRFARVHRLLHEDTALARDVRLLSLLTLLLERHGRIRTAAPPEGRGPVPAVEAARAYLRDNYAADVTLDELARVAGLSPFHFARLFRRHVGMPPHAYQLQVRISHAKRLLLRGMPVSRVAQETGFFDLSHLTRHFKRHVGVAPGSYPQR
ncbi:AraC family transcriptional regulator [Thermopolyspora flexuosa]|uniref:AraC family transcriptional regulator n=1 Tax=Thermopolyspora flexuosa TaxID=103836 RepID=UPI001476E798|nr:AraC family transcriptional regulator [Thermopolyspora flexuosa]